MVLRIARRPSYVLGKRSTTEPHTQPFIFLPFFWRQKPTSFPRLALYSVAQSSLKHVIVLCGLFRAGIIGLCYQILCGVFDVQRLSFVSRVLGPGTCGLGNSCLARPDRTLRVSCGHRGGWDKHPRFSGETKDL